MSMSAVRYLVVLALGGAAFTASIPAQQPAGIDPGLFAELRWRNIGPHRASRTRAAAGHASHPYTFYMAAVNGGVWKTTDAGRVWKPIFDDQPTGSIGTIAIAPSDANVIYVGSGEGLHRPDLSTGDGIYKSTDAGQDVVAPGIALTRSRFPTSPSIRAIPIDCSSPRSAIPTDRTRNAASSARPTAARRSESALRRTRTPAATTSTSIRRIPRWSTRRCGKSVRDRGRTRCGRAPTAASSSPSDGGTTWKPLTNGLPVVVQANLAISPANPKRLYAAVAGLDKPGTARSMRGAAGIYPQRRRRRDLDTDHDRRPTAGRIGGGDLPMPIPAPEGSRHAHRRQHRVVEVDRRRQDVDAVQGRARRRGLSERLDQSRQPRHHPARRRSGRGRHAQRRRDLELLVQPADGQFYHVTADNAFPYRVCSGQQENGSVCVSSRGNYGAISDRDWLPVGVDEYGFVAPDPLNPDIVYGGRTVTRFDRRTGQVSVVGPVARPRRRRWSQPGPSVRCGRCRSSSRRSTSVSLFFANNHLWKTVDGGAHWKQISPDLTRQTWERADRASASMRRSAAQPAPRGVIYTVAPSYQDINRIWVGTDDGLIHVTADGRRHLEGRHAAGRRPVGQGVGHRRRPLRSADRLRRRQHVAPRRSAAAHLPHARRRQDLDRDRQRHSRRRDGQRRS